MAEPGCAAPAPCSVTAADVDASCIDASVPADASAPDEEIELASLEGPELRELPEPAESLAPSELAASPQSAESTAPVDVVPSAAGGTSAFTASASASDSASKPDTAFSDAA